MSHVLYVQNRPEGVEASCPCGFIADGITSGRELYRLIETHGEDPGPTPPAWEEQEWCDGATCEHETCLAALDYAAFDD